MTVFADKIDSIRQASDIVAYIGAYVRLRRGGRDFVGLCPFHDEKTPSFAVSPQKAMYYCFGCHVGGDIFDFIMRYDTLTFTQATRKLAQATGIALAPEDDASVETRRLEQNIVAVNEAAQAFFVAQLWQPSGQDARAYLGRRRVPAMWARSCGLGAGGSGVAFMQHMQAALAANAYHAAVGPAEAGLLSEGRHRPLFSGRLTFPIHDEEGRLVGFAGRRLDDETTSPKYINSRETQVFAKRRLLFGLHRAQATVRRSRRFIFVEGYMDVLALQRAGLGEAVATMGTALTSAHASLAQRFARQAYLLMDADAAGTRATHAAARTLLAAGLEVRVVALPPQCDPDDVMRRGGAAALRAALGAATPAIEFFMAKSFDVSEGGVAARAEAGRQLLHLLAALPQGLDRDLYMSRLADKLGVSVAQLQEELGRLERSGAARQAAVVRGAPRRLGALPCSDVGDTSVVARSGREVAGAPRGAGSAAPFAWTSAREARRTASSLVHELEVVRELLLFPSLRARFDDLAEYMVNPQNSLLLHELADLSHPAPEIIARHVADTGWQARLAQVAQIQCESAEEAQVLANRTFDDILVRLKLRHLDAYLAEVLQDIATAEAAGQATEVLIRRKQELTARKKMLRRAKGAGPVGV